MNMIDALKIDPSSGWLFLPAAVVLGALHALEPGHSKSLMAAYVVAVRGTAAQAVLLGLSAATSHSIIVWVLALLGLSLGDAFRLEAFEPYLLITSGATVLGIALWTALRLHRDRHHDAAHIHHDNEHAHSHPHSHGHTHSHRHDGTARQGLPRMVTWREIVAFGFSGGLLPCPAAITVLILCLNLRAFAVGVGLVAAFSLGLALTLIAVGVAAAWASAKAERRYGIGAVIAARVPYASALLIALVGVITLVQGLNHLPHA